MRVILTKHGETIENKKGIIQGHLQGRLSKLGKEQAKKLAFKLRNEKIDYIYSSDLTRSKDTAKEIVKYHPSTPLILTKKLRERNLGELQGYTKKELGIPKTGEIWDKIKKGESIEQVYDRANKFIKELLKNHKNQNILLVGHETIDKAIICSMLNKPAKEIEAFQKINIDSASITIIEFNNKGNSKIKKLNSIEHLK
jgi:broad specificity phosphatase PhoE